MVINDMNNNIIHVPIIIVAIIVIPICIINGHTLDSIVFITVVMGLYRITVPCKGMHQIWGRGYIAGKRYCVLITKQRSEQKVQPSANELRESCCLKEY